VFGTSNEGAGGDAFACVSFDMTADVGRFNVAAPGSFPVVFPDKESPMAACAGSNDSDPRMSAEGAELVSAVGGGNWKAGVESALSVCVVP
jgi:hypothetical protein